MTVLVIDDSVVQRRVVCQWIRQMGWEAVDTDNPMLVPALLRSHKPNILLCDVEMPGVSGDQVARINRHGVSCILLHSSIAESRLQDMVKAGLADGYIWKTGSASLFKESLLHHWEALGGVAS